MSRDEKIFLTCLIAGLLAALYIFLDWLGLQIKEGFRGY
jgi:hypothetical protein